MLYVDLTPSDPTHPFDAMGAAQTAIADLYSSLPAAMSNQWTVDHFKVIYRADDTSTYSTTIADAIGGTVSGGFLSADAAYLINWVSGDARRGGKPRQYIPGVPESSLSDTTNVLGSVRSTIDTAIAEWFTDFPFTVGTGVCNGLVEMSFVNGKVDRTPPVAKPIIAGSCNPTLGIQRRRVERARI